MRALAKRFGNAFRSLFVMRPSRPCCATTLRPNAVWPSYSSISPTMSLRLTTTISCDQVRDARDKSKHEYILRVILFVYALLALLG